MLEVSAGAAAIRVVQQAAPPANVIAISVIETEAEIVRYAEAGIAGYVARDGGLDDLMSAIDGVLDGELICVLRRIRRSGWRDLRVTAIALGSSGARRMEALRGRSG